MMPACSIQERTYSRRGLFATGRRAFGQGSSPLSLVRGTRLGLVSGGVGES